MIVLYSGGGGKPRTRYDEAAGATTGNTPAKVHRTWMPLYFPPMRKLLHNDQGQVNSHVVVALIGAAATLLTAVIAGVFGLMQVRATSAPAAPAATVVPLVVEIDGPATAPLGQPTYFTIISENAARVEWTIAGFGGDEIDPFDQSEQIFVEPADASRVGENFTLVVTAEDANGRAASARHRFQIVEEE